MLTVFRVLYVAMIVLCVALIFTHGFWFAVGMFLFLGVLMWLAMTVCDFFIDVGNALTRPSQHLHVYYERHPIPPGRTWTNTPMARPQTVPSDYASERWTPRGGTL